MTAEELLTPNLTKELAVILQRCLPYIEKAYGPTYDEKDSDDLLAKIHSALQKAGIE